MAESENRIINELYNDFKTIPLWRYSITIRMNQNARNEEISERPYKGCSESKTFRQAIYLSADQP